MGSIGSQWQEWQEKTGGGCCSAGGEGQALCLRQWVKFLLPPVSCMSATKGFCFYLWKTRTTHLQCMVWSERPHLELRDFDRIEIRTIARLKAFFPPCFLLGLGLGFFFSWDAAPCVLCNFLLAIAHCANAHRRSMSLLLARQLKKVNQVQKHVS